MLNWSGIIRYVKRKCGFPYHFIEYTDKEIKEMLEEDCLRKFSTYFPDKRTMFLDCSDPKNKVQNKSDSFYITDPDGLEILSVDEFIPQGGEYMMTNHPYMGAFNYNTIPEEMALGAFQANNLKMFSIFNYTIKFLPPNQLRITPIFKSSCSLEYSRIHSPDLSTIPPDLIHYFQDFCLADFQMQVGSLRKNYSEITTPFGNVPINGDDIYSRGETLYNSLVEKFETSSNTFLIFDIG